MRNANCELKRPPEFAIRNSQFAILLFFLLVSCRQQMADQSRYEPMEESALFRDGTSARPIPAGAVARGLLNADDHLYRGIVDRQPSRTFPFEITRDVLERGRERYDIFCSPCHDYIGTGKGMVVIRGFRRSPPSFHIERMRETPPGHFFDVITNGFGAMNDYAMQIGPRDRWAIIAYIRALQLSQNASMQQLGGSDRREIERIPK